MPYGRVARKMSLLTLGCAGIASLSLLLACGSSVEVGEAAAAYCDACATTGGCASNVQNWIDSASGCPEEVTAFYACMADNDCSTTVCEPPLCDYAWCDDPSQSENPDCATPVPPLGLGDTQPL